MPRQRPQIRHAMLRGQGLLEHHGRGAPAQFDAVWQATAAKGDCCKAHVACSRGRLTIKYVARPGRATASVRSERGCKSISVGLPNEMGGDGRQTDHSPTVATRLPLAMGQACSLLVQPEGGRPICATSRAVTCPPPPRSERARTGKLSKLAAPKKCHR